MRFLYSPQLAVALSIFIALTASAQDQVNFKDEIDAAEKQLNGQVSSDGDLQSRLSKIEATLFGEAQKGAISDRIARVMTAVGLAGQHSRNGHEIKPPSGQNPSDENQSAPNQTIPSDVNPDHSNKNAMEKIRKSKTHDRHAVIGDSLSDARTLISNGKLDDARQRLYENIDNSYRKPETFYMLGTIAQNQGRLAEALANFWIANTMDPTNQECQFALNQCMAAMRNIQPAYPIANPEMNDQKKSILYQGVILFRMNYRDEAKLMFEQVARMDPHNLDAEYNLGALAEADGKLQEALSIYQATLVDCSKMEASLAAQRAQQHALHMSSRYLGSYLRPIVRVHSALMHDIDGYSSGELHTLKEQLMVAVNETGFKAQTTPGGDGPIMHTPAFSGADGCERCRIVRGTFITTQPPFNQTVNIQPLNNQAVDVQPVPNQPLNTQPLAPPRFNTQPFINGSDRFTQ